MSVVGRRNTCMFVSVYITIILSFVGLLIWLPRARRFQSIVTSCLYFRALVKRVRVLLRSLWTFKEVKRTRNHTSCFLLGVMLLPAAAAAACFNTFLFYHAVCDAFFKPHPAIQSRQFANYTQLFDDELSSGAVRLCRIEFYHQLCPPLAFSSSNSSPHGWVFSN